MELGIAYITRAELAALQPRLSTTELFLDLPGILLLASRLVDGYVFMDEEGSFAPEVYRQELHEWNKDTLRVFPDHKPVIALAACDLVTSPTMRTAISLTNIFINRRDGYLELVSTEPTLAEMIAFLGIAIPLIEVTYAAGKGAFAAATTLSAALDVTSKTFDVTATDDLNVGDIIRIGSEWMTVTALLTAPVRITVSARGDFETTAVAHDSGATVERLAPGVPHDVKVATALTAAAVIADQEQAAEGMTNIKQATIGSYSVTFAGEGPGQMTIPAGAQMLLDKYKRVSLA